MAVADAAASRTEEQQAFREHVADFLTYLASVRNLSPNTVRA